MYITFFRGAIVGAYQPPTTITYGVFSIALGCFQVHAPLCFQVHVWFQIVHKGCFNTINTLS
jgi:hypothetical protein